jgi:hypothetical protein
MLAELALVDRSAPAAVEPREGRQRILGSGGSLGERACGGNDEHKSAAAGSGGKQNPAE